MSKPDGENSSASSLFLPLQHPRRGSLASSSNPSRLDKDTLAQALDQIHSTASQSESLTTFNEYTSPPFSSSGGDGKGIASELHGGLSGLYSRIRASVGSVRDIVTLAIEENTDDQILKGHQLANPGTVPSTRHFVDVGKPLSPSAVSLNTNHSSDPGQQSVPERDAFESDTVDKIQSTKPSKLSSMGVAGGSLQTAFSSSSALHSPLLPLTQRGLGTTARPAVAEINISAIKDRNSSGDNPLNGTVNIPSASQRLSQGPLVEQHMSGKADKQTSRFSDGPRVLEASGNGHISHIQNPLLESAVITAGCSNDMNTIKDLKLPQEPGTIVDDYYFQNSGFDGIDDIVQPTAKRPSSLTRNTKEAPHIFTNSVTSREHSLEVSIGGDKDKPKAEPDKVKQYQNLELPLQESTAPLQTNQPGFRDRRSPRKPSFEFALNGPSTTPQQNGASHEQLGDINVRQTSTGLQSSSAKISTQEGDSRATNVFSQIKSKILNKEYWMRDENARDCFYCGDPFSTFRRKHHCSKLRP